MLQTAQGPCYYPAGHLWLYAPIYIMFTKTVLAEYILKLIHFTISSFCNYFYSKMAYKYFGSDSLKAQMVCFMLLANPKIEYQMYNDQFVVFFMSWGVYKLAYQRSPIWASVLVGIAISVKAPAVLVLPAFWGSIQYIYGTPALILSIFTVFIVQVSVALPFLCQIFGGQTSIMAYWHYSKYLGGDSSHTMTDWVFSINWQFISKTTYESQLFMNGCRIAIILCNIYHFFVKKNALWKCLDNLHGFFLGVDPLKTHP